jgi:hypothetical protein
MDMDIQHGHAAETWECSMDMDTQDVRDYSIDMGMQQIYVHVHAAYPCSDFRACPCCMSIFMLHSMSMLHVSVHAEHRHGHGDEHMDMDTQHVIGHAACTVTYRMDLDM